MNDPDDIGLASDVLTASRLVVVGPCMLWAIQVNSQALANHVRVFDGRDNTGRLRWQFNEVFGVSLPFTPARPLRLDLGLYVEVVTGSPIVTVAYRPLGR